jgi:hypothetical protein
MEVSKTRPGILVEKWPGLSSSDTWRVTVDGADPKFYRSAEDAIAYANRLEQFNNIWDFEGRLKPEYIPLKTVIPDTYGDF